eukprot:jgi/Tetstr1/455151/TSEL_042001.t1
MHHAVHPDTAETSVRVAPPKGGNPTLDLIHACKDTKLNKAINDKHNRYGAEGAARKALAQKNPSRVVSIGLKVWELKSIDTVEGHFHCSFRVFMAWADPALVARIREHLGPGGALRNGFKLDYGEDTESLYKAGVPHLSIINGVDVELVDAGRLAVVDVDAGVLELSHKYSGTLSQSFDLHDFPFDRQRLAVKISMNSGNDRSRTFAASGFTLIEGQVSLPEWSIAQELEVDESHVEEDRSAMHYQIPIRRKHAYYSQNFADRAGILLTILLTAVAFKFVVADMLPKVPYFTKLDLYVSACFALVFLLTVQMAASALVKDAAAAGAVDRYAGAALAASWALFHVVYIGWVAARLRRGDT